MQPLAAESKADDQDADCNLTYIHQHMIKGRRNQVGKKEVGQRIISKTVHWEEKAKGNLHS